MSCKRLILLTLSLSFFFSASTFAAELEKRTVCAWDPVGKNGPVISFFSDLIPTAIDWGLAVEFIPYEDERQAAKDLFTDKCDVAVVTAILSRDFVQFGGTLDAIGGINSEEKLRRVMASIASQKATPLMSNENFEIVASLPVGSMYAFVNDRKISDIDHFRNKRIAILNGDIQTKKFAELSGAIPVNETLSTFAQRFNDKYVDIVIMPALAYDTFELYRGLGTKGGIIDIRLFYGMLQAISKKSEFPDDFGAKMRRYMYGRLKDVLIIIEKAEQSIPAHYWINTPQSAKDELETFYKDIRLDLKVENQFDAKALSLLWKVRCAVSPENEECVMP